MIRKIVKMEFMGYGHKYFHGRYARVYLEGDYRLPSYTVSGTDLEKMAFGC